MQQATPGAGIDETATPRSVDLSHARPRALDGSDARPDKEVPRVHVLTCTHPRRSLLLREWIEVHSLLVDVDSVGGLLVGVVRIHALGDAAELRLHDVLVEGAGEVDQG